MARAWVAAFAGTALVLQVLLLSLTPPGARAANAIASLSASAMCRGSAYLHDGPAAPAPPADHARRDCCILCTVPGLSAGGGIIAVAHRSWDAPLAAPLAAARMRGLVKPVERAPIQARAPPA